MLIVISAYRGGGVGNCFASSASRSFNHALDGPRHLIFAAGYTGDQRECRRLVLFHRVGKHSETGPYEEAEPDAATLPGLSCRSADEVFQLKGAVGIQVAQIDHLRPSPITSGARRRCFRLPHFCHTTLYHYPMYPFTSCIVVNIVEWSACLMGPPATSYPTDS